MKIKLILILTLCFIIPSVDYAAIQKPKCTKAQGKNRCGAEDIDGCPKEGCGGDSKLNQRKNIKTPPAAADVETYTRADFVNLTFPAEWESGRSRTLLKTWGEGTAVEYEA
jgi:hypothetical protein